MRDNHIISLLDEKPVSGLSQSELAFIEAHVAGCSECLRAYEAARVAILLIKERTAEAVELSPFFKTRVLAAIKERQLSPELPALVRMWKAAGALVSAMAALVVLLAGLTFFSYRSEGQAPELTASQGLDSPEWVMFEQDEQADEGDDIDLVLTTIADSEGDDGQ